MHVPRTFLRFCIVGIINTGVDAGVFWLLSVLGWNIFAANLVSTSLGLLCSFVLNARYTFHRSNYSLRQAGSFVAYTGIGLWLLQPSIIWLLHTAADMPLIIGKFVAIAVVLGWNFYWYKNRVFAAG